MEKNCRVCNNEIPEGDRFCMECGEPLNKNVKPNIDHHKVAEKTKGTGKKKKGLRYALVILLVGAAVMIGAFAHQHLTGALTPEEQLSLANRYFSELDYENAILTYEQVIEIEPMNKDAYLGLAEVYVDMGNENEAIRILEKGERETGASEIVNRLKELKVEGFLSRAEEYLADQEYERAIKELENGLQQFDDRRMRNLLEDTILQYDLFRVEEYTLLEEYDEALIILRRLYGNQQSNNVREKINYVLGLKYIDEAQGYIDSENFTRAEEILQDAFLETRSTEVRNLLERVNAEIERRNDYTVVFHDQNLERVVREELGLPSGRIGKQAVMGIESLSLYESGVEDLRGLEELENLRILDLTFVWIENYSPVGQLRKLETLYVWETEHSYNGRENFSHIDYVEWQTFGGGF